MMLSDDFEDELRQEIKELRKEIYDLRHNKIFNLLPLVRGKRFDVINLPNSKEEYVRWVQEVYNCRSADGEINGKALFWEF